MIVFTRNHKPVFRNIAQALFIILLLSGGVSISKQATGATIAEDNSSAVIISYSRIGENQYPETNLRTDQFKEHLQELQNAEYNISALPEILESIQNNTPLASNSLAITFTEAYKSSYRNAMMALIEQNIPFTLFYAPSHINTETEQYLSWDALKDLQNSNLVTFGLVLPTITLDNEEFLRQLNTARSIHRQHLETEANYFAYPFGEYTREQKQIIQEQGFKAAFGLQSGAIYSGSDIFALPQFSITEDYGSLERFQLISQALPLPAEDIEPKSSIQNTNQPSIGFTLSESLSAAKDKLSCFVSGQPQPTIETLGDRRIELRLQSPLTQERTRINCTIADKDEKNNDRWRWLGMLLVNSPKE